MAAKVTNDATNQFQLPKRRLYKSLYVTASSNSNIWVVVFSRCIWPVRTSDIQYEPLTHPKLVFRALSNAKDVTFRENGSENAFGFAEAKVWGHFFKNIFKLQKRSGLVNKYYSKKLCVFPSHTQSCTKDERALPLKITKLNLSLLGMLMVAIEMNQLICWLSVLLFVGSKRAR